MALSSENFERLMNWLHANREEAGREYQRIRELLIKHFQTKGCSDPEKLADATMDRVAKKLTAKTLQAWIGKDKAKYFYRVGFYIVLEDKTKSLPETQMSEEVEITNPDKVEDSELKMQCLQKCMGELSGAHRDLIARYYHGHKMAKIKNRDELARELKISLPLLRVRALRIRTELKTCIEKCLEDAARVRKT